MKVVELEPPEPISAERVCAEAVERNGPTVCVWVNGHDEIHAASNLDDAAMTWMLMKALLRTLDD